MFLVSRSAFFCSIQYIVSEDFSQEIMPALALFGSTVGLFLPPFCHDDQKDDGKHQAFHACRGKAGRNPLAPELI